VKRNLLFDIGPSVGGHGARGIGRYVRGLVDAIGDWPAERTEHIWALSPTGATSPVFDGRTVSSSILKLRPLDLGWIVGSAAIGRAARRAGANVFHATDPHRPARLRGVRQIVTAYDLIPLLEPGMLGSWRPHHRHAYRVYLDQLRRADVVIAISEATAASLTERLGIPRDRIEIVYPVVAQPSAVHRAPSAEPTFIYVGALDAHKRPELAIEALARFRAHAGEGDLRFIGPSSEEQRNPLRAAAERLGVAGGVHFDGRVSDSKLDSAFESATALLSTSRIEGFGLPPVEAVLRGVPVISVDIPSARETVGEAATLVPPDAEAIAAAMEAPQPPSTESMARIRARYSKTASAGALWAAYSRLLS
jgi:glycosyltransferase involved in cell wall biosynthesis